MKKNVLLITICAILMPCTYARAEYRGGSNPSFVQEGIGYLILSEEARTVAVCGTNDSELTSVRITETVSHEGVDYTVESIADSAFYGHPSLQRVEVALSKTYTSVGNAVFGGCPSLREVVLGETKDLPYDTFEGSDHIESVSVNCQSVKELFSNKSNLKKIIFGPLVRQVGYLANGGPNILSKRANTSAGRERTIPQGVFYGCSALTEITLPESVKGIGDGCFACCENLETIVIPEHCVIGADAFYGTKWLAGQSDGIVYLNDAVTAAINEYLPLRKKYGTGHTQALFVSERGERIARSTVHRLVKTHLGEAGLDRDGYSAHKLRHTAATLMLRNGVDVRTLQELLGHEHLNTTEIYTHIENTDLRMAADANPLAKITPKKG